MPSAGNLILFIALPQALLRERNAEGVQSKRRSLPRFDCARYARSAQREVYALSARGLTV